MNDSQPDATETHIQKVMSSLSTPWRHTGGVQVQLHSFSVSALDGGERSTSRPGSFTPVSGQLHVLAALPWWAVNFTSRQLYPNKWSTSRPGSFIPVSGQLHVLAALPLAKNPGTHKEGNRADPKGSTDILDRKYKHKCLATIQKGSMFYQRGSL